MANQEQVDLLRQGVPELWNRWRLNNPDRRPELQGANLAQANLGGVNLTGADLTLADLTEANLIDALVRAANFSWTNVDQAIITAEQLQLIHLSQDDL